MMQSTKVDRSYNVNAANTNKDSQPSFRIVMYRFTRSLEVLSIISSVLSFFIIVGYSLLRIFQGDNVYSHFIMEGYVWIPICLVSVFLAYCTLPYSVMNYKSMYFTSIGFFFLLSFYFSGGFPIWSLVMLPISIFFVVILHFVGDEIKASMK